jgi:hypothetical protein
MHRLIWGIVIAVIGICCFASAGQNPQGPEFSIFDGFLFCGVGTVMIVFGARFLNQRKAVLEAVFRMIRKNDNKININELVENLGISEIKIRQHIVNAKRKGLISSSID